LTINGTVSHVKDALSDKSKHNRHREKPLKRRIFNRQMAFVGHCCLQIDFSDRWLSLTVRFRTVGPQTPGTSAAVAGVGDIFNMPQHPPLIHPVVGLHRLLPPAPIDGERKVNAWQSAPSLSIMSSIVTYQVVKTITGYDKPHLVGRKFILSLQDFKCREEEIF